MDWLTPTGLVIAILTGLAGTVLGIRAELRTSRYRPLWTIQNGAPIRVHNRTDEDALDVAFRLERASFVAGPTQFALIAADQNGAIYVRPNDPEIPTFEVFIYWVRPSNGKRYVYPPRHRWPGGSRDKSKVFLGDTP